MKINNSSALYKNLEEIKSRKPIYIYLNISKSQRRKNNTIFPEIIELRFFEEIYNFSIMNKYYNNIFSIKLSTKIN